MKWENKMSEETPCFFCGRTEKHEHDPAMVEVVQMQGGIQASSALNATLRMNELEKRIEKLEKICSHLSETAFDFRYLE